MTGDKVTYFMFFMLRLFYLVLAFPIIYLDEGKIKANLLIKQVSKTWRTGEFLE